jgi:hypothetical protein
LTDYKSAKTETTDDRQLTTKPRQKTCDLKLMSILRLFAFVASFAFYITTEIDGQQTNLIIRTP